VWAKVDVPEFTPLRERFIVLAKVCMLQLTTVLERLIVVASVYVMESTSLLWSGLSCRPVCTC
jgi:hypothetical protein